MEPFVFFVVRLMVAIWKSDWYDQMNGPNCLRQHGTFFFFFTEIWLCEPHVREKGWSVPPDRR